MEVPEWFLGNAVEMTVSGNMEPYLGSVGVAGWLSGGRVVIEDHQADQLHLFGSDGRHVAVLAGQGDGPGEIQDVGTLSVGPGDTLYVFDRRHRRLSVLHPDGGFLRSVSFAAVPEERRLRHVWAFGTDRFVAYALSALEAEEGRGLPRRLLQTGYLSMHDGGGDLLAGPVMFSGGFGIGDGDFSTEAAYSDQPVVAIGPRSIVHGSGSSYALTVRRESFAETRRIRWPDRNQGISRTEVDAVRKAAQDGYSEMGATEVAKTLADLKVAILPQVRPPVGRAVVDGTGRIWLSEFWPVVPGWPEPRGWHVLDDIGRPVGRLTLPLRSSLLAASRTSVIIMVRDSLDVEHVEVRRVVQEPSN